MDIVLLRCSSSIFTYLIFPIHNCTFFVTIPSEENFHKFSNIVFIDALNTFCHASELKHIDSYTTHKETMNGKEFTIKYVWDHINHCNKLK